MNFDGSFVLGRLLLACGTVHPDDIAGQSPGPESFPFFNVNATSIAGNLGLMIEVTIFLFFFLFHSLLIRLSSAEYLKSR